MPTDGGRDAGDDAADGGGPGGDADGGVDPAGDGVDPDLTARARDLFDLPFHREHGVEVVSAAPERARTRWPFDAALVGNPEVPAVHGGVVSAMADLTGAIPFVAQCGAYTPTVDLRVDYLSHAGAADLHGEATVLRRGGSVGVADVTVRSGEERCAVARGVYKLPDGEGQG